MKYYQLLVLGNGFDVHCGLKSRYEDFFRASILDTIGARFNLQQAQVGVTGFWENLLLEYYYVYHDSNYNWYDVEAIIKETLIRVIYVDEASSTCIWKNSLENVKLRRHYHEVVKSFQDPITQYLYKYCMQYLKKHLSQTKWSNEEDSLQALILNLLQELQTFERRFCKYIKDNIGNPQNEHELNSQYLVNAMNLLNKMAGITHTAYRELDNIIERQEESCFERINQSVYRPVQKEKHILSPEFAQLNSTHILSFNYTALFDILGVESPCVYHNVHGKLCLSSCLADCNSSSIIFGIDDGVIQSNNEYADLRLFSKTYRKMFDTSAPVSVLPLIGEDSTITIKFYGHSLNEADYSYFQSIFDYYNLYSNDHVGLVFYYSKGYEQTDSIYRLINTYGKSLSNKDQGKNLMHKLLLENRLKIIEID